jgi:flagellar hook assembly protein FlgD
LTEISEVIDDVRIDPNPFSPNGDGLYDILSIQFTLNTDALVTISVYDLAGELIRRLSHERSFLEGVQNVVWDGRDDSGSYVPYGFYFVFLYAKSSVTELPIAKFTKGIGVIR